MAKFPREEIGYKKLYGSLDLDRELGIEWPEIERPTRDATVCLRAEAVPRAGRTLDEYDEKFCREQNLSEERLLGALGSLDGEFERYLFERLDRIDPVSCDDAFCDVCGDCDESDGNRLFACNGCAIAVHQECYGILEPVGKFWFCAKCLFYGEDGRCFLCTNENGILKRTTDLRWVHAVCAVLHPSLFFANPSSKEPVDVSDWKRRRGECGCCSARSDTLIRCTYFKCSRRYHASCAAESLYCDLNNQCVYCPQHDFSADRKMIISRRKLVRHRSSYPLLDSAVFVRKASRLTEPTETAFARIVKTEPFDVAGTNSQDPEIVEYWAAKRRAFGTHFRSIFLYINHINRNE